MDKSHKEILEDCQAELQSLKERISALEEHIQALMEAGEDLQEEDAVDFTDVAIGVDAPVAQSSDDGPVAEPPEDLPEEDPTVHLPWRTDRPGIPVKNIRSGISLLDRALFVNTLFREDAALYDQTIVELNKLASLEEAVGYLRTHFPEWDLRSNAVYHFIMSIRKKLG